jgi:hypothetical protein
MPSCHHVEVAAWSQHNSEFWGGGSNVRAASGGGWTGDVRVRRRVVIASYLGAERVRACVHAARVCVYQHL